MNKNINEIIEYYRNNDISLRELSEKSGFSRKFLRKELVKNKIVISERVDSLISANARKRKYDIDDKILNNIDSEEKAYFLGFFYGDGHNLSDRNTVTIKIQSGDIQILEDFKKILKTNRAIRIEQATSPNKKDMAALSFTSKGISRDLIRLGAPNNKSTIIDLPNFLTKSLMKHFIRGLTDADGCISIYEKNSYKFCKWILASSNKMCLSIKDYFLKELNLNSQIFEHGNYSSIQVGGNNQVEILLDWLYAGSKINLSRKYLKYFEFKRWMDVNKHYSISKIESGYIKQLSDDGVSIREISNIMSVDQTSVYNAIKNSEKEMMVKKETYVDYRGESIFDLFPECRLYKNGQINIGTINSKSIKAFHMHRKQKDFWFCTDGTLMVVLIKGVDLIDGEYIKNEDFKIETHYISRSNGLRLEIPEGVWHGVKNVSSTKEATLLYFVTEKYDENDEIRMPWNYFGEEIWSPPPI